ncbi:MAG TPA: hypothetical protein VJG32_14185 [Anaerolineae bacterium]|nr:hypothetical protein [Anaerolineae bacterium]
MKNWFILRRWLIVVALFTVLGVLLSGCGSTTPEPTPTPLPPTRTFTPEPTHTPEPTSTSTNTPKPTKTATPLPTDTPPPTSTPSLTPSPRITNTPRATATPTRPPAPPLLTTVQETQNHVYSIGGAMDRIYHEGRPEACAPLLEDYFSVVAAPEYDVSGQPSNVQGAYGLYREGIGIIADKLGKIRDLCLGGGGYIDALEFDLARMAVNDAGSRLGAALGLLQTP